MFRWLQDWFSSRILNRHRLLFHYWNGSRFVSDDPFVLFRKLMNTEQFDLEADLKKLQIPDTKLVISKIGDIAKGVREIFNLPAFDHGGLSELECVTLLIEFSQFLERVKKNGGPNLTSQQFTASNL